MIITFKVLKKYLYNKYNSKITSNYILINPPESNYHITIFKDQWDNYHFDSHFAYHLFHISSNNNDSKCSSYFWVDKNKYYIRHIPNKYFSYNQSIFSYYKSTRNRCSLKDIIPSIQFFSLILQNIKNFYKNII